MDGRSGKECTGIHDKRGVSEGYVEREGRDESVEVREKSRRRVLAGECLRGMREKARKGKRGNGWEEERKEFWEGKG